MVPFAAKQSTDTTSPGELTVRYNPHNIRCVDHLFTVGPLDGHRQFFTDGQLSFHYYVIRLPFRIGVYVGQNAPHLFRRAAVWILRTAFLLHAMYRDLNEQGSYRRAGAVQIGLLIWSWQALLKI
jgi:hypothetical protein